MAQKRQDGAGMRAVRVMVAGIVMEVMFHSFIDRQCRVRKQNKNHLMEAGWVERRRYCPPGQINNDKGKEAGMREQRHLCKCSANIVRQSGTQTCLTSSQTHVSCMYGVHIFVKYL